MKNVSNIVDLLISSLFTIYSIERTVLSSVDYAGDSTLDGDYSYLPNAQNTEWTAAKPRPDGFLAYGVSMNFILAVLAMWKLLLLLKTNETMGKLIELVRVCALATVPFLVFFIIWCLIFEILFKALGSEVTGVKDN